MIFDVFFFYAEQKIGLRKRVGIFWLNIHVCRLGKNTGNARYSMIVNRRRIFTDFSFVPLHERRNRLWFSRQKSRNRKFNRFSEKEKRTKRNCRNAK